MTTQFKSGGGCRLKQLVAFAVAAAVWLPTLIGTARSQTISLMNRGKLLIQTKPPLKKEGLLDALRYAQKHDLPTDYLLQEVRRRGVDFRMTGEDEGQLRAAGADNELLAAVRSNYRTAGALPAGAPPANVPSNPAPARTGSGLLLGEDTPIRLRLGRTISSKTENVGDRVDFDVIEDVKVNNIVVIPAGTSASATITEAKKARRLGREGKLNVNIDYVRLASGEKVAFARCQEHKGRRSRQSDDGGHRSD